MLAKQMFENRIMAGASTPAGVNGLPEPLPANPTPEQGRGKNWLEKHPRNKNKTRAYKKAVDAKEFVSVMALQECRDTAPSFDKLRRELEARIPPPPPEPPEQPSAE